MKCYSKKHKVLETYTLLQLLCFNFASQNDRSCLLLLLIAMSCDFYYVFKKMVPF